jgi:hypothetical protein
MQELKIPKMTSSASISGQLWAIAHLRWRMFANGLRSGRGKAELASRIIVSSAFAFGGFGAFTFATGASWWFVSQDSPNFYLSSFGRSSSSGSSSP